MNTCIPFEEKMYDEKGKTLMQEINHNPAAKPFLFIQYHYWQLGKDDEWFLEVSNKLGDPLRVRREYLLEWINTNGNSPFEPEDMDVIIELSKEKELELETIKINKHFKMKIWGDYYGTKPVVISVDVSTGLGRDSSAITVINPENLMPLATFKSNMINSIHLKALIITLVTKVYPNCVLTVENNSIGKPLIDALMEHPHLRRVMYRERKKRVVEKLDKAFSKKHTVDSIEYGHNTNADSRAKMMEILETMVRYSKEHLAIPDIIEELKNLEIRNGRIGHSSSTHDDLIMSYMGGLYIIRYGTGLKGKGIYFNLAESGDEEKSSFDIPGNLKHIDRVVAKYRNDEEYSVQEYLAGALGEKECKTSGMLLEEQDRELTAMQYGLEEEEFGTYKVSDKMKNLAMRNMSSLMDEEDRMSFLDSLTRRW